MDRFDGDGLLAAAERLGSLGFGGEVGGPPMLLLLLRMDTGPKPISQASQSFCARKWPTTSSGGALAGRLHPILLPLDEPAWSPRGIDDFEHGHDHLHRHSALSYLPRARTAGRLSRTHQTGFAR